MDVSKIPLNPFLPVTENNKFVPCSDVDGINFQNIFNNRRCTTDGPNQSY